jgi:hypothetical protein
MGIKGTWEGTPNSGSFMQQVDVSPGTNYALCFYYLVDTGFTATVHTVQVDWLDSSSNLLDRVEQVIDLGDQEFGWKHPGWNKCVLDALKAPDSCARANISFNFEGLTASQTVMYIDDTTFSDNTTTCLDAAYPVSCTNAYELDFQYLFNSNFFAHAVRLHVQWLGTNGALLRKDSYPLGFEGNPNIWQDSGTYFFDVPLNAVTAQVQCLVSIPLQGDYQVRNPDFRLSSPAQCDLHNNSFEQSLGHEQGNWTAEGQFDRVNWQSKHGDYAAVLKGTWSGTQTSGSIAQQLTVQENTEYEAVFEHFWDNGFSAGTLTFFVEWYDTNNTLLGTDSRSISRSGNEATWYESGPYAVTSMPAAVTARLGVSATGIGEHGAYYVDSLFFREPQAFFARGGTNILSPEGVPFLIDGIALSGWFFPEAYMFGIEGGGKVNTYTQMKNRFEQILGSADRAEAFWDAYTTNFLTENDVALLSERGVNTVRLPFNYRELSPQNNEGAFRMKGFEQLDRVIQWCKNQGVYVILDMHGAPGGQAAVNSGDPEYYYDTPWGESVKSCMWEFVDEYHDRTGRTPQSNARRAAEIWRFIAKRYRNEPHILGYELMNEPYLPGSSDVEKDEYGNIIGYLDQPSTNFHGDIVRHVLMQISDAVRQVDDQHLFFVEGDMFAEWIHGLTPLWDDNMAIAFHRYWKTNSVDCLDEYVHVSTDNQVPLWLSESGENSNPWCRELVNLCNTHNIGRTFWAWKKSGGNSGGFIATLPATAEYVVNHMWSDTVDADLFEQGLYDMAEAFKTENCREQHGYFAALFEPLFDTTNGPLTQHLIPGTIYASDYDVGDINVAYLDDDYKSESYWNPVNYNQGGQYRNDGVDISRLEGEGNDLYVSYIYAGEWIRYTVDLLHPGIYALKARVATPNSGNTLEFLLNGTSLSVQTVPNTGGWETFADLNWTNEIPLAAGTYVLEFRAHNGGFNLASLELELAETGFVDYDENGICDHWEIRHGGTLDPNADSDGDTLNNLQEYYGDTDPYDSHSLPRLERMLQAEDSRVQFLVPASSTARQYRVEYSTNLLADTWQTVSENVIGLGGTMPVLQTDTSGYYRVKISIPTP